MASTMMTLDIFEQALREIPPPGRNDRAACEGALTPLLRSAPLDENSAEMLARLIALGMDLFQETGLRPLFMWIDDRDQSRLPAGALPYHITLASALIVAETGHLAISVWEMAERENHVSLLLSHSDLASPFSGETPLKDVFAAPPPSHTLYQDLRWVPYRYKPETDTFLDADCGPPDIPAQYRFLRRRHTVGMNL
jgi:hypothetical protein